MIPVTVNNKLRLTSNWFFGSILLTVLVLGMNTIAFAENTEVYNQQDSEVSYLAHEDFPELIDSFRSDVTVNKEGTINVVETILYDFHDLEKHGIFRDIPLTKVAGSDRKLSISNIAVLDENGKEYTTSISWGGDVVRIKIGDADKTVTGEHTYKIYYTAKNAIGYFDDRDEIYWNTTGNEWNISIWDAEAHVFIPGKFTESNLMLASFCGETGSKDSCQKGIINYNERTNQTEIIFKSDPDAYYNPGEGMTVAVGFPKGLVDLPIVMWWEKSETYLFATLIVIALFIILLVSWLFGFYFPEKLKRRKSIMVEYTPPSGISPSQASYIYDGSISLSKVLSADILYLASRGFLSITKEDKKLSTKEGKLSFLGRIAPVIIGLIIAFFVFGKFLLIVIPIALVFKWTDIKDYISSITDPAEFILTREKVVGVETLAPHLSSLLSLVTNEDGKGKSLEDIEKDKDYVSFNNVSQAMSDEIDSNYPDVKIYKEKISLAINTLPFFFLVAVVFAVSSFIGVATNDILGGNIPPTAFLAGGTFLFLSWLYFVLRNFLSAKLYKMTDIWYKVAGLREYINVAEKERLTFQNDPEQSLKIYSILLPYATAFGLEQKWSKVFDGIVVKPPEWYHSNTAWSTSGFSRSIGSFSVGMLGASRSGMPVSSGSSGSFSGSGGGGSSGGGGGGGGGGSW